MTAPMEQCAFQIEGRDNVATALTDLLPGSVRIFGDAVGSEASATEPVPAGHKMTLCDIKAGAKIYKYGICIGEATRDIAAGGWVHLHCMKSLYDERSSHLDPVTGAPRDTRYE